MNTGHVTSLGVFVVLIKHQGTIVKVCYLLGKPKNNNSYSLAYSLHFYMK